ncbi:acetyltransferase, GNAT family [Enterococcus faecalis 13-SD-W-01]|nr:acetyltransferase, GNAT family [Enterococcus faecalis 13-SD-W-01]
MSLEINYVDRPEMFKELMPVIKEVWEEAFTPIIGADQVKYMLETYQSETQIREEAESGVKYFLLEDNGEIVGYTAYELLDDAVYLSKLYLLKKTRGKGHTSAIFSWYENLAKEAGKSAVCLRVHQKNQQAIDVYQHKGFVIEKELISDIGQGYVMDDYWMKKTLA